jgi:hypothetical protein
MELWVHYRARVSIAAPFIPGIRTLSVRKQVGLMRGLRPNLREVTYSALHQQNTIGNSA